MRLVYKTIMGFSSFFSEQARQPSGWFGRLVMAAIFDKGNAFLNAFINDLMAVTDSDHILEIGFGTGALLHKMARQMNHGFIEGIDFSDTMISIAQRRNRINIANGMVRIVKGNFDEMSYQADTFTKVCSVNTIYFWPDPEFTANKIANLLKPGGKLFLAFEDQKQLRAQRLDEDIFSVYSPDEVKMLLLKSGFSADVRLESRSRGNSVFHCVIASR